MELQTDGFYSASTIKVLNVDGDLILERVSLVLDGKEIPGEEVVFVTPKGGESFTSPDPKPGPRSQTEDGPQKE